MGNSRLKFRAWDKDFELMDYRTTPGNLLYALHAEDGDYDHEDERRYILMQFSGLRDNKRTEEYPEGQEIYEGDVVELDIGDGEKRRLIVRIGTVNREVVCYPGFAVKSTKVSMTGVFFEWEGYQLLPCVDDDGISDSEKVEVIGNIYEHPHLLGDKA